MRLRNLCLLGVLALSLAGCFGPKGAARYERFKKPDIKDDFCGPVMNFQYCKCAFHGEFCEAIGMDEDAADEYVREEYDKWVKQQREVFAAACRAQNGFFEAEECTYCEREYVATDDDCLAVKPDDTAGAGEEEGDGETAIAKPDGPFNDDCSLNQDEYDREWRKYSDIDNAIAPTDRSWEAQQLLRAQDAKIALALEGFELERDLAIEQDLLASLAEYRQAIVLNQQTNLLKAFWRLAWITGTTIKSGAGTGRSYSKLVTGTGEAIQQVGSALKVFQAGVPASSDLAIDKSSYLGKAEALGAKTAIEAVETLGDPGKVAARFLKTAGEVSLPSANITPAEVEILRQQQLDKGMVDEALAQSRAQVADWQARLAAIEAEIKNLDAQIADWEGREKERVGAGLVDSCRKQTDGNRQSE